MVAGAALACGDADSDGVGDETEDDAADCLQLDQFGSTGEDWAHATGIDSEGSIYVAGETSGELGANASLGLTDAFFSKLAADGTLVWTRQIGTELDDSGFGLAVDSQDRIYLGGVTEGEIDGNPSLGGPDVFIRAHDADGATLWTRQFGTPTTDEVRRMAVDGADNVYLVGWTSGELDGSPNAGEADLFVAKYAPDGARAWLRQFGTDGNDYAFGVAVDESGLYVTGDTEGEFEGNPIAGGADVLTFKLATDGSMLWARQLGSEEDDRAYDIAVGESGDVYLTGYVLGAVGEHLHVDKRDVLVASYSSDGTHRWTALTGTSLDDYGQAIFVDDQGDVQVAGHSPGDIAGTTSAYHYNAFILSYDVDGTRFGANQFGTEGADLVFDTVSAGPNEALLVGRTSGEVDGDASSEDPDVLLARVCTPQ